MTQFEVGLASGGGIFFGPSASDLDRIVGCANGNGDCASALRCASSNHGPDWCATHARGGCDGNTLIFCISGWGLEQTDCGLFGQACREMNGSALCTDGKTCAPGLDQCEGSAIVSCDATTMLESRFDCGVAVPGTTCQTFADPTGGVTTGCYPPAGTGCGPDSVRCDGTTAVSCSHGRETRIACGQFNSHCVMTGTGTSARLDCVPNATDCNSMSPDRCNGSSLEMCVNGKYADTPCSSIGFTSCQAVGTTAACR